MAGAELKVNSSNIGNTATPQPVATQPVVEQPLQNISKSNENLARQLQASGQINTSNNLSKDIYSNVDINNIEAATKQEVGDVTPVGFEGLNLPTGFNEVFSTNSQILADSTNNIIDSLESQFNNQILPALASAAQDKKVLRGQLLGDVGVDGEESTRNLSLIQDADATYQQQVLAATNEFASQITEAALQNQAGQNDLLGQAVNLQSEFDARNTELFGTLFNNGVDTGLQTQQGKINELSYDNALFEASRLRSLRPGQTAFEATGLTTALEQAQLNQSALTGINLQQAQLQLDNNRSVVDQLSGRDNVLANAFDANGNLTAEARNLIDGDKQKYGSAVHTYYGVSVTGESDESGNLTIKQNITVTGDELGDHGLLMNLGFEGAEYNNLVADLKDDEKPHIIFEKQIANAINSGESHEAFNKVLLESDDANKMLIAMKNTSSDGSGFVYREIDMSGMNQADRGAMEQELASVNPREGSFFANMNDILGKYGEKGLAGNTNLDFSSIIDRMNSVEYQGVANQRISSGLPKNKALFPLVVTGTGGNVVMSALRDFVGDKEFSISSIDNVLPDVTFEMDGVRQTLDRLGYSASGDIGSIFRDNDSDLISAIIDGDAKRVSDITGKSSNELESLDLNLDYDKLKDFKNKMPVVVNQTTGGGDANRRQVLSGIASILAPNDTHRKGLLSILGL